MRFVYQHHPRYDFRSYVTERYAIAPPPSQKNATGYGDNDVGSTIFGRGGWRQAKGKKKVSLGFSDAQMTRVSLVDGPPRHALRGAIVTSFSLRACRSDTLSTPHDARMTRLKRAMFWVSKKNNEMQRKIIASVGSDNKDEMCIPAGPKQG